MDDQLGELSRLLCNLPDTSRCIFPHLDVHIFQTVEDSREDLRLYDDLSKVDGMFGDLRQARAHLALELGVGMRYQCRQIGHSALINDGLGQFLGMFGDLAESSCRNSFECELRLLNAQDEQADSAGVNDSLG